MKKYTLLIVLIFLAVFHNPNGILGGSDKMCSEYHVVTFKVGANSSDPDIDKKDLIEKLRNKKRSELDNKQGKIGNNNVILNTQIPEYYTGNIIFNVPGLICSCDKHTYPERAASVLFGFVRAGVLSEDTLGFSFCPQSHKRDTFNFGLEEDQKSMIYFLNKLAQKNPQARIIVMGTCSGATGILNTLASGKLTQKTKNQIEGIVLESPATSCNKVWEDMGNNYLPYGLKWLFPWLAWLWFSNCKETRSEQEILDSYDNIPNVPVLIAQLKDDAVTPPISIKQIEDALRLSNKNVQVHTFDDPKSKHGNLAANKGYQQTLKKFLQKKIN